MNCLITGGNGRLGVELMKLRKFDCPTHKEMDITSSRSIFLYTLGKEIDLIVHCAGYTNVAEAERDKKTCYNVNVNGTKNLSSLGVPILYISTEYVFDGEQGNYKEDDIPNPINFYSLTKLLGEFCLNDDSRIIRLSFKPRPYPYDSAFTDQWTSGDYVDVMAKEVNRAIDLFNTLGMVNHLGTGRKSIYDLASRSKVVGKKSINEVQVKLPKDTSLDCSKWEIIKEGAL